MFDSSAEIEIQARLVSTGGEETGVTVRWPSDEEWAVRNRTHKILIRRPGRGVSETIPSDPNEADVKLYTTIAINGAPAMTPAEAMRVLDAISTCDVVNVSIAGVEAIVEMNVLGGKVIHKVKVPSADQVMRMRRAAYRILDLPYSVQEIRTTPEPAAHLYDECGGQSTDYKGAIPVIHKDQVIRSVVEAIDRELGPKRDESNF